MLKFLRLLFFVGVFYGVGFGLFLAALPAPFSGIPVVDGVVVFTGGTNRVPTAVEWLREGYTGPVLISGVHPDVTKEDLMQGEPLNEVAAARLALDIGAQNTKGNVRNTRLWAEGLGLTAARGKSVGILTSTYHVPRVRLLAVTGAPGLDIVYLPVQPQEAGLRDFWREYNKLIFWWAVN